MAVPPNQPLITIEGTVERITYANPENHYTIARLRTGKSQNLVTIVGYMPKIHSGDRLKTKGNWETHAKYGQQFKILSFEVTLPESVDGIRKYLASGLIKGVGPKMVARLMDHFKEKTLETIERYPDKLTQVDGIGKKTAHLISRSWKEHHVVRDLIRF